MRLLHGWMARYKTCVQGRTSVTATRSRPTCSRALGPGGSTDHARRPRRAGAEMRQQGLSESTIAIAVGVVNRIYRYAARRLGCSGSTLSP